MATWLGIKTYLQQRIGRIRLATERMPCLWLWSITIHLPGELPMGSAKDHYTAKAKFREAWKALKAKNHAGATRGGLPGHETTGISTDRTNKLCKDLPP